MTDTEISLGYAIGDALQNEDGFDTLDLKSTRALGKRLRKRMLILIDKGVFDKQIDQCLYGWIMTMTDIKQDWFWEDFGNDMAMKIFRPFLLETIKQRLEGDKCKVKR